MIRPFFVVLAMAPALARAVDMSVGAVELSGFSNLQLSTSSTESGGSSQDETGIQATVTGLVYVTRNVGVGIVGGYQRFDETFGGSKVHSWSLGVGPAIALVFPIDEKLSLVLRGDAGYQWSRSSGSFFSGGPETGSAWAFDAGPGLRYFVARWFSVDSGVQYSYVKRHEEGGGIPAIDTRTSALRLSVGVSGYFGN